MFHKCNLLERIFLFKDILIEEKTFSIKEEKHITPKEQTDTSNYDYYSNFNNKQNLTLMKTNDLKSMSTVYNENGAKRKENYSRSMTSILNNFLSDSFYEDESKRKLLFIPI